MLSKFLYRIRLSMGVYPGIWPGPGPAPDEPLRIDRYYCEIVPHKDDTSVFHTDGLYDDFNGPAPASAFFLDKDLKRRFREWSMECQQLDELSDAGKTVDWSAHTAKGLELARAAKQALPIRRVIYWDNEQDQEFEILIDGTPVSPSARYPLKSYYESMKCEKYETSKDHDLMANKYVCLMADCGIELWGRKGKFFNCGELGLGPDFQERLYDWGADQDRLFDESLGNKSVDWSDISRRGWILAKELKSKLPKDWKVEYYDERQKKRCLVRE